MGGLPRERDQHDNAPAPIAGGATAGIEQGAAIVSDALTVEISLDGATIDRLAASIASRLPRTDGKTTEQDGWLTTKQAAAYLGLTVAALHRLTAARRVPFVQDGPGARCWFRRSDLDAWREQGAKGPIRSR